MHAADAFLSSSSVGFGWLTAASRNICVRLMQSRSFSAASVSARAVSTAVQRKRPAAPPSVAVMKRSGWIVKRCAVIDAPIE
jgi:hypothetical protein